MTDLTPGSRGLGRVRGCCATSALGAACADEEADEEEVADDAFRLVPGRAVAGPSFGGKPHPLTSLCARSRALSFTKRICSGGGYRVMAVAPVATLMPQRDNEDDAHDGGGSGGGGSPGCPTSSFLLSDCPTWHPPRQPALSSERRDPERPPALRCDDPARPLALLCASAAAAARGVRPVGARRDGLARRDSRPMCLVHSSIHPFIHSSITSEPRGLSPCFSRSSCFFSVGIAAHAGGFSN